MAYVRGPTTSLESSASLLPCNLSILPSDGQSEPLIGVIHKHVAVVGHLGSPSTTQRVVCYGKVEEKNPLSYLTQVRWCKLENGLTLMVLASYKGFQILDRNGTKDLYSNLFETPPGSKNNRFAKGAVGVRNCLCVGTSEGAILVFSVNPTATQIELTKRLEGHGAAISDLITDPKGRQLLSADEQGSIYLWQDITSSAEPTITINDSSGVPCLCLAFNHPYIVGGFAHGQLRLYNCETGVKVMEVCAHARPVTALDVAPSADLLLSASEEGTVCVWSMPRPDNQKLALEHLEVVKNAMLTGARFTDAEGTRFAVSAYDSHEVATFIKKSTPV